MLRSIISLIAAGCMATTIASAAERTIHVLQTTDVHGNYYPHDFITGKPANGSLARVCSAVRHYRDSLGTDNVVTVDNGDILQGQPTAYYYNYVDTLSPHLAAEMLGFIGYDAANVGNHDMETSRRVLERWASDCPMPVLGANIIDTSTGQPAFAPYKIVERDGIRIAIFGLLTPAIPAWLPESLWKGYRFDDMEETAARWIPLIREREHPDAIIGLFHSGQAGNVLAGYRENASLDVARRVPGFDVVMMGHDHRRENKWVVNTAGDSVLVINPANNAVHMADVALRFVSAPDGKMKLDKTSGRLIATDTYAPDPAFMARFEPQRQSVSGYVAAPIGEMSRPISTRDAYFGPSEFVDLIHELQLAITGAEISMAAPLSYDAAIPEGTITMADMFGLYKYENMLYVMELTGREIKDYLELSYGKWTGLMTSPDDHLLLFKEQPQQGDASRSTLRWPSYNFDSAAGIIYEVDVTRPMGQKVAIKGMADGRPFDPGRTYRVALNSYRGNGGGELLTKGAGIPHEKLSERIVFSTDRDLRHYLTQYIRSQGELNPRRLDHWRFVPDSLVAPAADRDRRILFPE